jgi:hypothetical protein
MSWARGLEVCVLPSNYVYRVGHGSDDLMIIIKKLDPEKGIEDLFMITLIKNLIQNVRCKPLFHFFFSFSFFLGDFEIVV